MTEDLLTPQSRPGSILLVDDDAVIRTLVQRILEQVGHNVVAVSNGNEALTHFSPGKFDLLITDVNMPQKGGFELLNEVKNLDPYIDLIMITGQPDVQEVIKAMRDERVADFIIKPFNHVELRQIVSKVLGLRYMREHNQMLSNQLRLTNERQARQITQLSRLAQITSQVSASLDEAEVFSKSLHRALELFDFDWAIGARPDQDTHELVVAEYYSRQTNSPNVLNTRLVNLPEDILTNFWHPSQTTHISTLNLEPDHPLAQQLCLQQPNVLLLSPLNVNGEPYSIKLMGRSAQQQPTSDEEIAFTLYLQHVSQALVNARLHSEVHILATTDPLTGLLNRRELWRSAEASLARLDPESGHASVIMLDIDHFKTVNDTYGHTVGDEVLKMVGQVVRNSVRQFDLVGRYGGEEFMAVLINADYVTTEHVAERVWRNLAETPLIWEGQPIHITASLGGAISAPQMRSPLNRLVVAADEALYQAKQLGRNQMRFGWQQFQH